MKYIFEYSKRGLVNLLAEKICKKLNENEKYPTFIEVVDCVNFFVVKGYTSNTKVLNLTEFKDEFLEEQKEFLDKFGVKKFNFIDVIDYRNSPELDENSQWFEFWNSKRPSYNSSIIDLIENNKVPFNSMESIDFLNQIVIESSFPIFYDESSFYSVMSPINISSTFPFGYSLTCGKTKYYYCEHICYQLFSVLNTDKILFKISKRINERGDLDIDIVSNSQYKDEDVKSMVLDIFDFNLTKFQSDYLKNFDFMEEIKNPFEIKPWINKDKVRELMFV